MIIYVGTYVYMQAFKHALTVLNKLYDLTNDIDAKCDLDVFNDLNDIVYEPNDYKNGLDKLRRFATVTKDPYLNTVCDNIQTEIEKQNELIDINIDDKDVEVLNHVIKQLETSYKKQHILECLNFDVPYQICSNLCRFTIDSKQIRFNCELALNTLKDYNIVYKENIDSLIKKFEEKL